MNSICLFCASSLGKDPEAAEHGRRLGRILAENGITLVYGGACVGVMLEAASEVMNNGGRVVGIMPELLTSREVASNNLTEKYIVGSMAERKKMMIEKSDAFVILPGGVGTMDEFFEVVCLESLGECRKPVILLNTNGYYDYLWKFLRHSFEEGMLALPPERYIALVNTPEEVIPAVNSFVLPPVPDWVKKD